MEAAAVQPPAGGGAAEPQQQAQSRFTLLRHIRSGAYGSVYAALDAKTGQQVAVKKVEAINNHTDPNDQGVPVLVLREGVLLRRLDHANIVAMRDIFLHENTFHFVMDLCDCNLREYVNEIADRREWMPPEALRSLTHQLLSAVQYCHDRRIVHRDLKPDNVLLDSSRTHLRVADFGMARVVQPGARYTERVVTVWYRPPEVALGDSSYDERVDMWSVGCVLVEMMGLAPPFCSPSEIELLLDMFHLCGTPNEGSWPGVSALPFWNHSFPQYPGRSPARLLQPIYEGCPYAGDAVALALAGKLVVMCPQRRLRASEALQDEFFTRSEEMVDETGSGDTWIAHSPGGEEEEDEEEMEESDREPYEEGLTDLSDEGEDGAEEGY